MDGKYTQKEFLDFSKEMHDKAHAITAVKNTDYSPGENPFSNFEKLIPYFGPDWPLKLLVARMHEKLDRITNLSVKGQSDSNSEPLSNNFYDLMNYAVLTFAYIESHPEIMELIREKK
jgi:hypothetical protein